MQIFKSLQIPTVSGVSNGTIIGAESSVYRYIVVRFLAESTIQYSSTPDSE